MTLPTPASADAVPPPPAAGGLRMMSGLRRRLLVLIIAPLILLALVNAWIEYRSAESASGAQDQQLQALLPLLADSVVVDPDAATRPPALMLAPAIEQFLEGRRATTGYAIADAQGRLYHGEAWLLTPAPEGREPTLDTREMAGLVWRVARQRQQTVAGELILAVGDASTPRQHWVRAILLKVLLPHLVILAAAGFAVMWAVDRALKPLLDLTGAVERRSPQDLAPIDDRDTPREVRPLVAALNRLLALSHDQAEHQRRFIADAAHQLRTPLAGLQSQVEAWAQAARRIVPPGASGSMLVPVDQIDKLRSATRRTSQLAHQLLALSRAEARSMASQPMEPVDLRQLCESQLEAHLDLALGREIDLGLDVRPAVVPGHDWLLRELLANLVNNAVKYTPAGGTVTIRCGPTPVSGAFVEVEDDRPGVPTEHLPRLLDRFYRVPGTAGEGTGLGLAIADEIARVHRGVLDLAPGAGGRGLRVRLDLPGASQG